MQIKASKTMNKAHKKYSQPSSKGHRKCRVQLTFLVSVSRKLKIHMLFTLEDMSVFLVL